MLSRKGRLGANFTLAALAVASLVVGSLTNAEAAPGGRPGPAPGTPADAASRGGPPAGFRIPDHVPWKNRLDKLPQTPAEADALEMRGPTAEVTTGNCYPQGHAGYEPQCVYPNFWQTIAPIKYHQFDSDSANSTPDGKVLDVYIVDEIEGTRASEWLQWLVYDINTNWGGPSGRFWRPTFYYLSSNALRASAINQQYGIYNQFTGCQGNWDGYHEFCPRTDAPEWSNSKATMRWYPSNSPYTTRIGHARSSDAFISGHTIRTVDGHSIDDFDINYNVSHEWGHVALGLAHNQECASPMTYCDTAGTGYLWFTATDMWTLSSQYDGSHHS